MRAFKPRDMWILRNAPKVRIPALWNLYLNLQCWILVIQQFIGCILLMTHKVNKPINLSKHDYSELWNYKVHSKCFTVEEFYYIRLLSVKLWTQLQYYIMTSTIFFFLTLQYTGWCCLKEGTFYNILQRKSLKRLAADLYHWSMSQCFPRATAI